MQATLKSFASLLVVLVLLGGSAWVGVWRLQRGTGGAQFDDDDLEPGQRTPPVLVPNSPLVAAASDPALSADSGLPRVIMEPAAAMARAQLDLAQDLRRVQRAIRRGGPFNAADLTAMGTLLEAELREPGADLRAALQTLIQDFSEAARERIGPELLPAALQFGNALRLRLDRYPEAQALLTAIESVREREERLAGAEAVLASEVTTVARLNTALTAVRQVLEADGGNTRAQRALEQIERRHIDQALARVADGDFQRAEEALARAAGVRADSPAVVKAGSQVRAARLQAEAAALQDFEAQVLARDYDDAARSLDRLLALPIDVARAEQLRERLQNARLYGNHRPGASFSDALTEGGNGPRMKVLPVGSLRMGSPDSENGRRSNEGPQRVLRIHRGLAMAMTETTVAEFRQFVQATGHVTDAERLGYSQTYQERTGRLQRTRGVQWRKNFRGDPARDRSPVVHVSHRDAEAYARWLADQTGARYRLPTEAEFEYALRGDTRTPFWWGEGVPTEVVENLTGSGDSSRNQRRWNTAFTPYSDGHWGPAPVRSFKANGYGLYDMAGNVSEWVQDCWHDSYLRAPDDLSAWVNPGCDQRVVRGGSWGSPPAEARSAFRMGVAAEHRGARVGFRVVREL